MAIKRHIPLLTPSRKESNLRALDVEAVDSQTLKIVEDHKIINW